MTSVSRHLARILPIALFATSLCSAFAQSLNTTATPVQSIWQRQRTPNIGAANVLLSLSADSPSDIWSVGDFVSLKFDGSRWTAIPLVAFQTKQPSEDTMTGVATLSSTDVWAVGSALEETISGGSHLVDLIEHFDGTQWSIVSSPQFTSGAQLNAVQAISSTDIFAAGESNSDGQQPNPLLEHFDGTSWSVVPLPAVAGTGTLRGIAALSDSDIWIIGDSGGVVPTNTLAMHFDGEQWNIVPVPVPANGAVHDLRFGQGITAIATNDVWAVGNFAAPVSSVVEQTLTAHWDGHSWKIVPSPNVGPAGSSNSLKGVAAVSSNDVWACGQIFNISTATLNNLIEHWDGTHWTISPVAKGNGFAGLNAALAFSSGSVFIAGSDIGTNSILISVIFHTNQGE